MSPPAGATPAPPAGSTPGPPAGATPGPPAELIVHNAVILDGDPTTFTPDFADHWLAAGGGVIIARGRGSGWTHVPVSTAATVLDAAGAFLAPAYVDIHCHGGGGCSAEDGEAGLSRLLDVHRAHGTRGLVLSYVSDSIEGLCESLTVGSRSVGSNPALLGLHAEGPFLASDFRGAHAPAALTHPTAEAVDRILEAAGGTLAQITLAPELPGALEAIGRFTSAGVTVAVGHTAATYEEAAEAFAAGASVLTHTFNGMPGIHHRSPGPILAAVDAAHVTLELINDGVHVAAAAARMITALAPGRVALITDSTAATGMGDGDYRLGRLPVRVEDAQARVLGTDGALGALAGSTLSMDDAVARAVAEVGMSPVEAVRAASLVPLRALGLVAEDVECLLHVGMPADFLLLDDDMSIRRSWIGGDRVPR